MAKFWALVIFVIASITDAYDGYFARKYDLVTPEGKFLDPLADKILVLSAFISFAYIGIIDYWMVALIIFRDAIVTGLRIALEKNGLEMVTSVLAKVKTTVQIIVIILSLIFLGLPGMPFLGLGFIHTFLQEYEIVYFMTLGVSVFTVFTGFVYIYTNRSAVKKIFL